jgi:hypothetical protein
MTPIDRLAREICWAEFAGPRTVKRIGKTKAAYWAGLPSDTREMYAAQARWFVYILREIPVDALNDAHNMGEAKLKRIAVQRGVND